MTSVNFGKPNSICLHVNIIGILNFILNKSSIVINNVGASASATAFATASASARAGVKVDAEGNVILPDCLIPPGNPIDNLMKIAK